MALVIEDGICDGGCGIELETKCKKTATYNLVHNAFIESSIANPS